MSAAVPKNSRAKKKRELVVEATVEEKLEKEEEETEPQTFEQLGIHENIIKATKLLGWEKPTPIQLEAIPHALQGKDIVALAQTGSGKTGAFALPILNNLIAHPKRLSVLVLAPTRELAVQTYDVFCVLGRAIGADCACVVGGVDMAAQAAELAKKPFIIAATPGRLVDHLKSTKGFSLRELRVLVLDEADRMLSMDFEQELNTILSVLPSTRTTMLFSATMTDKVEKLQRASVRPGTNTVRVQVSSKFESVQKLDSKVLIIPSSARDKYLVWMVNDFSNGKSIIVFTETCSHARRLAALLQHLDLGGAICLHGQMPQSQRLLALTRFKTQQNKILIATDVAARGLDIPSVDLVINYDVPKTAKDYIHRIGRTARAGRSGKAVTIVTQYDVETFQKIESTLGKKLDVEPVDKRLVDAFEDTVKEAGRRADADMREEEKSEHLKKKRRTYKS
ncbi:hypothetical protein BASA81_006617 [Batrachochytrium salamandrivorans]|nr:hypothetical protein BASA81_006617 [Batrachochytrium salamandrivorans]